jgi:predicted SAM-dependent methyltransferase
LAWLWLTRETPLLQSHLSFLHVAPEAGLTRLLASLPNLDYLSGDLVHRAMVRMDVGQLPFRGHSFDMIYCSHVLNMLPEDEPAMTELHRVLKPKGLALIQVPDPVPGSGLEASPSSTPEERLAMHGDPAMFRRYGLQCLLGRLRDAGFVVEAVDYFSSFATSEQRRLGLIDEKLFLCRRQL